MKYLAGVLFILSAPTGCGKTTLAREAVKNVATNYNVTQIITYTTRKPRPQEVDGIDYHFITLEDFIKKQDENFFLETTFYDNHWYGSARSIIDEVAQGKSFLVVTDLVGAKALKHLVSQAVCIWLAPPDITTIIKRLHKRSSEKDDALNNRIKIAQSEIATEKEPSFAGIFKYRILNDTLTEAIQELTDIITNELNQREKNTIL